MEESAKRNAKRCREWVLTAGTDKGYVADMAIHFIDRTVAAEADVERLKEEARHSDCELPFHDAKLELQKKSSEIALLHQERDKFLDLLRQAHDVIWLNCVEPVYAEEVRSQERVEALLDDIIRATAQRE